MGLRAVASDFGPYAGQTHLARLAKNSPEDWAAALVDVLGAEPTPTEVLTNRREFVRQERMFDSTSTAAWARTVLGS